MLNQEALQQALERKTTSELHRMLEEDRSTYTEAAVQVAERILRVREKAMDQEAIEDFGQESLREVLLERGVDLPRQKPSSVGPTSEQDRRSSGGFFSFRRMVSAKIVKILYSLGALLITITGLWIIAAGFQDGNLMRSAGIALVVILGNLAWRLVCEAAIVLFSIHEVLVSIERKLG
jgi:hypothetical protein